MKNEAMKWIIGTLTTAALGMAAFFGTSMDNRVGALEKNDQQSRTEIAVIKEILSQINSRTYQMDQVLDVIRMGVVK